LINETVTLATKPDKKLSLFMDLLFHNIRTAFFTEEKAPINNASGKNLYIFKIGR